MYSSCRHKSLLDWLQVEHIDFTCPDHVVAVTQNSTALNKNDNGRSTRSTNSKNNKMGKNRSTILVNNSLSHKPKGKFKGRSENRGRRGRRGECRQYDSIVSLEVERCIVALSVLKWC